MEVSLNRMESFYLGAYWGNRRESALQCGERLARCVARLGGVDAVLGGWFRRARSKAAARTPVDLDPESLGGLFAQGRDRRDVDGEVIEELGFSVGLWNRATPAVGLSATAGAYPSFPGVVNSFLLEFPPPEGEALRLYEPGAAQAIFDAVVEAWEPAWATWTSNSLRDAQDAAPREPVVGWLTYLATPVSADIPGVTSRPLQGGSVLQIGKDVTDVAESTVLDARHRLKKTAALSPIPLSISQRRR
jgi:hypothetical protein